MAFFASGLVGVSVALAVVAVTGLAARVPKGAVRRRHGQRLPALLRLTLPLARVIAAQLPIGRSTFDRRISLQLERAGLQQILTPVEFYVLGACTACLLIVSTMLATTPYSQSSSHSVLLVAVASTCGLVYPWVWLRDTICSSSRFGRVWALALHLRNAAPAYRRALCRTNSARSMPRSARVPV